jgi:Flp pilus assembly protein TadG
VSRSFVTNFTIYRSDQRGNVAVTFGVMFCFLTIAIGAAVEFNRLSQARSEVQAALDAAALAGATSLQVDHNPQQAERMARAIYTQTMMGRSPISVNKLEVEINDTQTQLTTSIEGSLPTQMLGLVGINRLQINSLSQATAAVGGAGGSTLEVSVMLDVTSSMCDNGIGPCTGGTKLNALKAAAKDLVNIIVPDNQPGNTSRVALVPFSTRVRIDRDGHGEDMMTALTNLPRTWSGYFEECLAGSGGDVGEESGVWTCTSSQVNWMNNWDVMPCVTDRYHNGGSGLDVTEDPPGPNKWLNAHDGGRMPFSWDSSDTPPADRRGLVTTDPADHWNYRHQGPCSAPEPNQIMPLTRDKDELDDRIDELEAYGSTAGALGTAWSWYMLSPQWSSIWTGTATPAPYSQLTETNESGAPRLRKVAVLMSDGVYNTIRGSTGQDQQTVSNHATTICANMKAQGIEIFSVGFALNELSGSERTIAENTLRSCGTDVAHFYNTLDPAQLRQAFRDIAMQLAPLYVSK